MIRAALRLTTELSSQLVSMVERTNYPDDYRVDECPWEHNYFLRDNDVQSRQNC